MSTWSTSVTAGKLNYKTENMVEIENLTKVYGDYKAVNIASLHIEEGCMLGLVGNNGAGKTTLFRLILDLIKPESGSVRVNGIQVDRSEEWKQLTGAFIDSSFLIDFLTPEEYFHFVGKMYGMSKELIKERVGRYEHLMGGEIMGQKKYIRNFSAGNKQKIGIVSAMIHNPRLLILDEPFNFLDPSSQNMMCNLLKEYQQETGAAVLISSHNLAHTVDISSRVVLLEKGVVIKDLDNSDRKAKEQLEAYFEAAAE